MKYISKLLGIIAFTMIICFTFISCVDPMSTTNITINNKSSYDLNISFIAESTWSAVGYVTSTVNRDQSTSFKLVADRSYTARNPNEEVSNIVFSNLENEEIICEIINKNLFKLTKTDESGSFSGEVVWYLLEVDDELLLIK
jgi:hypothetical protein